MPSSRIVALSTPVNRIKRPFLLVLSLFAQPKRHRPLQRQKRRKEKTKIMRGCSFMLGIVEGFYGDASTAATAYTCEATVSPVQSDHPQCALLLFPFPCYTNIYAFQAFPSQRPPNRAETPKNTKFM
jgi:hypothetical protein